MPSLRTSIVAGWGLGTALLIAGCASDSSGHRSSAAATESPVATTQAVACDKCRTVFVQAPIRSGKGGQAIGYATRKEMDCPDCRGIVDNFFRTGQLKHTCAACNGAMQTCDVH